MRYTYKGMLAGLFAAVVVGALLMVNAESRLVPQLDLIAITGALTGAGTAGGWIAYFILAASVGGLFAWLDPDLPGDNLRQRGMILTAVIWLLAMMLLMPLAGFGFFGLSQGIVLPLAALALHLIFGAVMGGTYGWLLLQATPLRYRQHHGA